jgi:hypothetical protein
VIENDLKQEGDDSSKIVLIMDIFNLKLRQSKFQGIYNGNGILCLMKMAGSV